ncbi:MAG: type II secretion system F family protein [Candidatus Omnitrophica bacterium]|nr:type II secretion system F family protein [Candidatus Omnitrophota bacterium]
MIRTLSMAALARFFEDFYNMHTAGMGTGEILGSLKETTKEPRVNGVLSMLEQKVREGRSLAEVLAHSGAFPSITAPTLYAGERAGKLQESLLALSVHFRRAGEIHSKLANAFVYPSIVFIVLLAVMFFIGLRVVPQLQDLLPAQAMEQGPTRWVLAASMGLRASWFFILMAVAGAAAAIMVYRKKDREGFQRWLYQWPLAGGVVKELDLAQYLFNCSILLKSGVPLLTAIEELNTMHPGEVSKHFFKCRDYMFGGMAFWEAVHKDKFFSMAMVFMLRRGEEMGRLEEYCLNLAEYLNKRAAAGMEALVHWVQPVLLALAGLFLAVVAFAFLGPIYGSLTKIAGG